MAKLIIIRGNSGSGKTTVARALQRRFGDHSMLISQDMVRREILHVKGEKNMLALPLMQELVACGRDHCEITILEGILTSQWYEPLFDSAKTLFGDAVFAYYYDLPFEVTLLRHQTKSNREEFGESDMRDWWREKDYLKNISENALTAKMSLEETIERIYRDVTLA